MTLYNTLNVKLSHSQLNTLKPAVKNGTEVTLNLSSNLIRRIFHINYYYLIKNSKIHKAFANGLSDNKVYQYKNFWKKKENLWYNENGW